MEICSITTARAGNALGEHDENFVELCSCKIAIRISTAHRLEQLGFVPIFGSAHGHNLLRQNVKRSFGNRDAIEISLANCAHECSAFQQLVASCREDPAFGHGATPVTRSADTLQTGGNRTRRTDQANQVDCADIDAKLERCSRYKGAELSGFQFLFGYETQLARQTSVMRGDGTTPQALGEMMTHALGETAGVDEDKS